MDTTYQDDGMLKAFGLVYELLRNGVPVQWVIRPDKAHLGVDFTVSAVDHKSRTVINSHGYRGGPWVIDSRDAAKALPIVDAWQKGNPAVAVHEVTATFWGDVARYLIVAPTIAMHQDGNEKIARSYLQAAGIPDSTLDPNWPVTSPDMLTPAEVAGPSTANHHDGMLFDADGDPVYCQFMSMHWGVNEAAASPETVLEVREYLKHPVHFFAECQAVNAFEGAPPSGGRANLLTTQGFQWTAPAQPKTVDFYNDGSPFAQIDGAFRTVGGSEPAYSPASGSSYHVGGVVMITKSGTPEGDSDVWMTGFLDGACPPDVESCENNYGKVSYLGGHQYPTTLPISKNPQTQGTRLFLNSLFEAPCATRSGQPDAVLVKTAPATTASATVTFTVDYSNAGSGVALSATLADTIPAGATFVSASAGYALNGSVVSWDLGNLGSFESGQVSLTVSLSGYGTYANTARLQFRVGLNSIGIDSNTTSTIYDADSDGDGVVDSVDICPDDYNTTQSLRRDALNCNSCGNACSVANGTPACVNGTCAIKTCQIGYSDCDGLYTSGCEHADVGGTCCSCSPSNATGACVAGACAITSCSYGFSDCDRIASTGCEYADSGFANDPNHCGNCETKCSFANATALCIAGVCMPGSCSEGFVNVDSNEINGCECRKIAVTDTTCNGVDDDCNGLTDDGYAPTSCGIGACAAKSRCLAGTVVPCSAGPASVEGPAGDATCEDGADNDCDGAIDAADIACLAAGGSGGTGPGGYAGASSAGNAADSGGKTGADQGGAPNESGGANAIAAGRDANTGSGATVSAVGGATKSLGGSAVASLGGAAANSGGAATTAVGGADTLARGGASEVTSGGVSMIVQGGTTSTGTTGNTVSGRAAQAGGAAATAVAGSVASNPGIGLSHNDHGANDGGGCSCRVVMRSQRDTSVAFLLGFGIALLRKTRRRYQAARDIKM
jgi:uncharacterized repeat protein (TIGR01451 family)